MTMNMLHRWCCSSSMWATRVERQHLHWALSDIDLGSNALEIGPGYGANLRILIDMTPNLTALEIDAAMADGLRSRYGDRARIITGDGTETGLPSGEFSSVVCFTMLHHVPTPALQDRLFGEAFRMLDSGGVFAGSDGLPSLQFRLMHIGDAYNPVHAEALPQRLRHAGFDDVSVDQRGPEQRWRAIKS